MKFRDNQNRKWIVRITVPLLKRVRDELGIDIGTANEFLRVRTNIIDLVDVLYVLCQKEAIERGVSDTQFGESLHGDGVMQRAIEAFEKAYLLFCPSDQADLIRRLIATAKEAESTAMLNVDQALTDLQESLKSRTRSREPSESNQETSP